MCTFISMFVIGLILNILSIFGCDFGDNRLIYTLLISFGIFGILEFGSLRLDIKDMKNEIERIKKNIFENKKDI